MHVTRACRSSLLAVLASFLSSRAARAEPEGARRLSWARQPGAEACIGEDELRRNIAAMLGRDPFMESNGPVFSGVVRREGDGLTATLTSSRPGEPPTSREFNASAGDCAPLTDAVALAVVLSVEHAPSAEPSPALVQPAPAPPRAELAEAPKRAPSDTLAALGHAYWSLGMLPRPTTGVGITARYKLRDRVTLAAGSLWLPAASERGQLSVGLAMGRFGACVESLRASPVALTHCAYGLGGAARVESEAGTTPDTGLHPWFAGSFATSAVARFGDHWVAEAGAEGAVPFARPTYATSSCPRVGFQQPAATLGIFLSVGAFFL
jgi:hypothetical protein